MFVKAKNLLCIVKFFTSVHAVGADYNVSVPFDMESGRLMVTLQPGATVVCVDVRIVDDLVFDSESDSSVEEVMFFFVSSSPLVVVPTLNSRHTLIILDNDGA